jgi:hypothetical protein
VTIEDLGRLLGARRVEANERVLVAEERVDLGLDLPVLRDDQAVGGSRRSELGEVAGEQAVEPRAAVFAAGDERP